MDVMAIQKYDIERPDSEGGGFEERYWSPVNSPVLGADNEVAYIIHRVEDVTQFVQLRQQRNEHYQENQALRVHTLTMEAEPYSRVQALKEVNSDPVRVQDECKQAEQRLQLYADVVRNAQVGIVVWQLENLNDPGSFRLLIANPTASEATGINFEQLIGTRMAENFPMLLQTPLVQHYMDVIRTGVALDLGEVPYSEDGITTGIYSLKAFPLPNYCLGLAFENITAQKHTEAQLRESQRLRQQIAETVPGILFVYDRLEQRNIYANRQITDLLGYTPEQVEAMGADVISILSHPDDLARIFAYFEEFRSVPEGEVRGIEYRNRHVNGEWRWLYSQAVVFNRTVDGVPRQILGVAIDISDRKLAEKALQESEERARLAIKVGRLGTWRYDPSTDFVELDERMREIWGEPDDAVTLPLQRVMERIHPDDRARVANAVSAALAPSSSGTYEIDYRVVWSDGTEQWLLANGQAQFEGEGVARRSNGFLGTALNITDRKQLEATLRHSEQRYRSLIEATSQIIWDTRAEGEFVTEQPGWSAFTGQTFDELKGWGWLNAVHPDDQAHTTQVWSTAVALSTLYEVEHRLRRHDGMYRHMSVRAVPVFEEDGTIREWIGIHTDVTDRKQAEEALRQREAELRLITNAVPVLISFIDSEQRYRFNNQKYEEWFGHLPNEIYGKPLRDVLGEAAYATIRPYVERVLAGEQVTFESQIPDQDGATRYVDATYIPQFDAHQAVVGFVALVSDISDRKRAEAEQQKLITLIDNSPDFIGIASMDGQAQYVNPAGRAMVGLDSLKQVQQIKVIDCFLPEDRAFVQEHILPTALRDGTWRGEYRFRHFQTGVAIAVDYNQFVIKEPQTGELIGFATVTRDIRDRKLAEAEREQLLAREQAAREQAETANRIKDEFLAVLSHELRSPLNPILGWSRLLQDRKLDEKRMTYALETIERNAKIQVQLIDDLLDVARILRGKLSLNVAPVNLAATITAALETVRLAAEAKSIQIQTMLQPDVGKILGDSGRLQQVIWNLMSNAVKFTPQGGRVELRLEQFGTNAQITVSDTGKGIHPDFLPYVFEYFRQADSATTRQFGGLGLGLAIVHQIVELHGGTVQAASPGVGQGATFTVQFPLMPDQSAIPQKVRESKPPSGLQDIKVLVVEDTTDMRDYITFVLEQEGAKVVAVATAAQALTALDQFQPEVLVSDIGMPEMDGYMLMRQVRRRSPQQGGQTPAVALTAYAGEINQQQAIAAGFQRHLAKPVEPEALVKVIAELAQQTR
jgi:PAS domain S-box-containing protein